MPLCTSSARETSRLLMAVTPFDGCLEFPAPGESDGGGGNLLCAACGCHRSFHWKKIKTAPNLVCPNPLRTVPMTQAPTTAGAAENQFKRRKRERTKFTHEQKERMRNFADSFAWRMSNCGGDDEEMERFLEETGVSRRVFKVWMHNHRKEASKFPAATVFSDTTEYNDGVVADAGKA